MKKILIAAFAALAMLTSCNLDVDYVYPNAEYLIATESGGDYPTLLYASGPWSATIDADEKLDISITPASGTGDTNITISLGPFKIESEEDKEIVRMAYVQFICGKSKTSFPVYQMSDELRKKLYEDQQ